MTTKQTRRISEKRFVEAMYYDAFRGDPWEAEKSPTTQRYTNLLCSAAKKLSIPELTVLANIADGIDDDGQTLRTDPGRS